MIYEKELKDLVENRDMNSKRLMLTGEMSQQYEGIASPGAEQLTHTYQSGAESSASSTT